MKSIERMPVVEQVTARLKEYIQSDERQVGEKLPTERELCDDLNVGRSTLREAVRILQASGFVENRRATSLRMRSSGFRKIRFH